MDLDDLEPRKPSAKPKDLSIYSIEDLQGYIAALEAEIQRAREVIARKAAHKDAASTIFKSDPR